MDPRQAIQELHALLRALHQQITIKHDGSALTVDRDDAGIVARALASEAKSRFAVIIAVAEDDR